MSTKKQEVITRKYSDAFKRQVVESVEEEGYTQVQASRQYGCSRASIQKWIKKFGKNNCINRVVKIQTMEEASRIEQLKSQVDELKKALADAYLEQKLTEAQLGLACEQLQVTPQEFKKKQDINKSK